MRDNSLKGNGRGVRQGAAEISPADYPLGSPESRAAARALGSERTALSPTDGDALTLYVARNWLSPQEGRPLEATAVYQRGKELQLRLFGSTCEEYDGGDLSAGGEITPYKRFNLSFTATPNPETFCVRAS